MTISETASEKLRPLAMCVRPARTETYYGARGDMRLAVSPKRYLVQRFDFDPSVRGATSLTWHTVQAMYRSPGLRYNGWGTWQYECATRMFERRCRERHGVLNYELWPSQDGRLSPLPNMSIGHLRNALSKIQRDGWRPKWEVAIIQELKRRGERP